MESYNIIRIIIVLISGMSIYFGYKLFYLVTERQGTLKIEGKEATLSLQDVGPGIFFALFGSIVLIATLATQPYSEFSRVTTANEKDKTNLLEVKEITRNPATVAGTSEFSNIENLCTDGFPETKLNEGIEIARKLFDAKKVAPYDTANVETKNSVISFLESTDADKKIFEASKGLTTNFDLSKVITAQLYLISIQYLCK